MKITFIFPILLFYTSIIFSQELPLLKTSTDNNYIVNQNNEPFFWLGGTAWELIHRLNKEDIDYYLTDRANKGFTIIQTVILAELDGLNTPNIYGQKPLLNNDPTTINEKYFEHVDYAIKKAEELGLYIGLLPTWGDKFNLKWGIGPEIFTIENAEVYGEILAKRYLKQSNIVWILGGDRIPEKKEHYEIIKAMAKGIKKIDSIHLMTYHPSGSKKATDYFNENWLDLDMFQSGHDGTAKEYNYVIESKKTKPTRPVIEAEARYENIPDRFWEDADNGWLSDADVRLTAYWTMLSGAAGYTYGCNDVWQMYAIDKSPELKARTGWKTALQLPGAQQMQYMKGLFTAFSWQQMKNDQSLILNENPEDQGYIVSSIGEKKTFIIAYTPRGKSINLDLSKMSAKQVIAFWYNPRSGNSIKIGNYKTSEKPIFSPWSTGKGSDFILIIMDKNKQIKLPGLRK